MNTITQSTESVNTQSRLSQTLSSIWNYFKKDRRLELVHESEQTKAYRLINTPYTIVHEGGQWFNIIGENRVSEKLNSKEEAIKDALRLDTEKVLQLIVMVLKANDKLTKK